MLSNDGNLESMIYNELFGLRILENWFLDKRSHEEDQLNDEKKQKLDALRDSLFETKEQIIDASKKRDLRYKDIKDFIGVSKQLISKF